MLDQLVQMLLLNRYQRKVKGICVGERHKNEDIQTTTFVFFYTWGHPPAPISVGGQSLALYCGSRAQKPAFDDQRTKASTVLRLTGSHGGKSRGSVPPLVCGTHRGRCKKQRERGQASPGCPTCPVCPKSLTWPSSQGSQVVASAVQSPGQSPWACPSG